MPDLVGRKFSASAPNRVYVGDITYLPCKGGKNMYVATVTDTSLAYTCRIWHSQTTCGSHWSSMLYPAHMVCVAVLTGPFFIEDHGSVYTSQTFRNYCSSLGVRQSMGAVGTSADRSPSRIV
ncbi:DDE-type integrase/transposase/recombinase [Corynebacterium macginleyi]|uniref:DDE-type integrase/transposase/recombinase n=1 Tax=Corynebacterium macginleyi TaxID=38290 RepID=UPI00190D649B|nr:DDE-type integrase/transposase/recombinase [Corynebacterium macginleyi]